VITTIRGPPATNFTLSARLGDITVGEASGALARECSSLLLEQLFRSNSEMQSLWLLVRYQIYHPVK
jgi:hypothetical protein